MNVRKLTTKKNHAPMKRGKLQTPPPSSCLYHIPPIRSSKLPSGTLPVARCLLFPGFYKIVFSAIKETKRGQPYLNAFLLKTHPDVVMGINRLVYRHDANGTGCIWRRKGGRRLNSGIKTTELINPGGDGKRQQAAIISVEQVHVVNELTSAYPLHHLVLLLHFLQDFVPALPCSGDCIRLQPAHAARITNTSKPSRPRMSSKTVTRYFCQLAWFRN